MGGKIVDDVMRRKSDVCAAQYNYEGHDGRICAKKKGILRSGTAFSTFFASIRTSLRRITMASQPQTEDRWWTNFCPPRRYASSADCYSYRYYRVIADLEIFIADYRYSN